VSAMKITSLGVAKGELRGAIIAAAQNARPFAHFQVSESQTASQTLWKLFTNRNQTCRCDKSGEVYHKFVQE